MIPVNIVIIFCLVITLICITAYIDLHRTMLWYKKQFEKQPRHPYRLLPKHTWQQKILNTLLIRKSSQNHT